jgi:polyhydroxyalkanoate synthesis regulator phasin
VVKRTKLIIVAGGVAGLLLAVALGAIGGFVASEALSDDDQAEAVAVEADVEPDDTSDSLSEALEFLVDEAVEADRLTEEEGERLKDRLQSTDPSFVVPGLEKLPFGGRGFELFYPNFGLFGEIIDLDAAASYLGLTESVLRDELEDGNSLADVARERGRSVDGLVQELVEEAEKRIDDAVADGRLSEDRATRLKDDLEDRVRDRVEDEFRFRTSPFGFRLELDPTLGPPPGFRGPSG